MSNGPTTCGNPNCDRADLNAIRSGNASGPIRVDCLNCGAQWNPADGWSIPEAAR